MKELWIDRDLLKEASGWTNVSIERRVREGSLRRRDKRERGANGRPVAEYYAADLPAGVQMKLHELRLADSTALVPAAQGDLLDLQITLPLGPRYGDGGRVGVPLGREAEAERLHNLIKPLLEWNRGTRPQFLDDDGTAFRSKDQLAEWIARHSDPADTVARATLWRMVKKFKKDGLGALLPKVRSDKGRSRCFDRFPMAAKFVLAKYAEGQGNYSDVLIREALAREWSSLCASTLDPPSVDTVRNFLQRVPPSLRDVVRLPRQEHDQKNAPYLITDIAGVPANGIWVSDHRIYDVLVYNDCFVGAEHLAALRLWETCIVDMRTRVVVGSVWNVTPSSRTIASALREALSKYGKPHIFYCDNGKDFRKIGGGWAKPAEDLDENGAVRISPATEGLLTRLGIEVQYCIPRHPQSKLVESYFSTVSKRFDVIFGPSYTGRNPKRRPDTCREAERLHRLCLKGERKDSPFMPASHFIALHRQWTEEFNSTHEHGGRGMEERSPYAVMNELLPPENRIIPDMAELEPLFWDRVERIVSNCKIERDGIEYEAGDEADAAAMYLANGTKVLVARDPEDTSRALALNQDGQLIARLHSKELAVRGPQSEDAIKGISRLRGHLIKAGKRFWKLAEHGVPKEIGLLAARAKAVPPASDSLKPIANRLALAAAVGNTSPRPLYTEDIVERVRAALRASKSNSSIHCAEDTVDELIKEGK